MLDNVKVVVAQIEAEAEVTRKQAIRGLGAARNEIDAFIKALEADAAEPGLLHVRTDLGGFPAYGERLNEMRSVVQKYHALRNAAAWLQSAIAKDAQG